MLRALRAAAGGPEAAAPGPPGRGAAPEHRLRPFTTGCALPPWVLFLFWIVFLLLLLLLCCFAPIHYFPCLFIFFNFFFAAFLGSPLGIRGIALRTRLSYHGRQALYPRACLPSGPRGRQEPLREALHSGRQRWKLFALTLSLPKTSGPERKWVLSLPIQLLAEGVLANSAGLL